MTVRTRILLASVAAAAVPLLIFTVGARQEVADRLDAQYQRRVQTVIDVIRADLAGAAADIDRRLSALGATIADDARVRAALMQQGGSPELRDYAARVMPATGLDYLVLLDDDGTILSAGHFRSDYGRPADIATDAAGPDPLLIHTRRPSGSFLALARVHRFTIAGRSFRLAGGIEVSETFLRRLARDDTGALAVTLSYPGGVLTSAPIPAADGDVVEDVAIPFVDDIASGSAGTPAQTAVWRIRHSAAPLAAIQRGMDTWLLAAIITAVALALVIARVLAVRVNRPLEELAARARRIDLDRLDTSFETGRYDEVGALARVLDAMVQRLRAGAAALRSAERRATVGDIARQVNHDIRNGLLPIRNVIRHLDEVAHESPEELPRVFAERASTLRSGVVYLEELATSYARLSPPAARVPVEINEVIRSAVEPSQGVTLKLGAAPMVVSTDPISLRRVVENLVVNALDSLQNGGGSVTVTTDAEVAAEGRRVVITVADTGSGIAPEDLDRIFDDFHTTKPHGTGLGLSIVRRLVNDMGGRIRVASEPGRGTTFRIELPEAG